MTKLVDDWKHGCQKEAISGDHMAQVAKGLGEIGYKNAELIRTQFDKLQT